MPELPELETIAFKLNETMVGLEIERVKVYNHIILYGNTVEYFEKEIVGKSFNFFKADGKFIIAGLSEKLEIIINPMLTGRIRVARIPRKPIKEDAIAIYTEEGSLWYSDRKKMGRVYLVRKGNYSEVADYQGRGPSALDPDLTIEEFRLRIKRHNGQIKNILRNQRFVKGIGNAYADEILLFAGILPFRRRASLAPEEVDSLFNAMKKVLSKFKDILMKRPLNEIALEKRDFLMVHGKHKGICPLCGNRVSEVTSNRFKTNYCQTCQK